MLGRITRFFFFFFKHALNIWSLKYLKNVKDANKRVTCQMHAGYLNMNPAADGCT